MKTIMGGVRAAFPLLLLLLLLLLLPLLIAVPARADYDDDDEEEVPEPDIYIVSAGEIADNVVEITVRYDNAERLFYLDRVSYSQGTKTIVDAQRFRDFLPPGSLPGSGRVTLTDPCAPHGTNDYRLSKYDDTGYEIIRWGQDTERVFVHGPNEDCGDASSSDDDDDDDDDNSACGCTVVGDGDGSRVGLALAMLAIGALALRRGQGRRP
ncbi:MAG: hypothetical protein H6684_04280 [Deltaproteobacteria bacterium]|nr:hypothetical protein [Deltaproteobacteria bacterium]